MPHDFSNADFIRGIEAGYLECAEWADVEERFTYEGFSPAFLAQADIDCEAFFKENAELIRKSGQHPDQVGHDFWLTRNRHGAGFWDRNLGDIGEKLTTAAHAFKEISLYIDDNLIYGE